MYEMASGQDVKDAQEIQHLLQQSADDDNAAGQKLQQQQQQLPLQLTYVKQKRNAEDNIVQDNNQTVVEPLYEGDVGVDDGHSNGNGSVSDDDDDGKCLRNNLKFYGQKSTI